ncbi:MAG: RES domain-containing protein [Bacteroidales bacterium]|nr:RES domain-containing protein [Bacteroidales bacterium]
MISRDTILDLLNFLVAKKLENSPSSYISIKNALNIFSIPFPIIRISKGTPLFRARVNDNENILFNTVQDLGHIITRNRILDFGRANEPLQSIFYCSTSSTVARFETSRIHRNNQDKNSEEVTIGKWILNKDIFVARLPSFEKEKQTNEIVNRLDKEFDDLIKTFENDGIDDWKMVLKLFSIEFMKKDDVGKSNYLISSAFSNYVYYTYGTNPQTGETVEPDGIMYPSVQFEHGGMNIALKPELIEDRSIELTFAAYQKLERFAEKEYRDTVTIKSKNIDYNSYEIQWEQ